MRAFFAQEVHSRDAQGRSSSRARLGRICRLCSLGIHGVSGGHLRRSESLSASTIYTPGIQHAWSLDPDVA